MSGPRHHISICICTFKRPQSLERLLESLAALQTESLFDYSAVVVDNDIEASGGAVVAKVAAASPVSLEYQVEPERGISHARNRSVAMARGDLIAFIDDDEFPNATWLLHHFRLLTSSDADGVLGPVLPHLDGAAPGWLVRSGLLDRKRFPTGTPLTDSRYTRTGNVLIRKRLFSEEGHAFDPTYGLSGGGDTAFFKHLIEEGKTFLWCDEACVFEILPPERRTKSYYIRRALTRGMTAATVTPVLSIGTAKSLIASVLYALALPLCLLLGQHRFMACLIRECDHLGKLLAYCRIRLVPTHFY